MVFAEEGGWWGRRAQTPQLLLMCGRPHHRLVPHIYTNSYERLCVIDIIEVVKYCQCFIPGMEPPVVYLEFR